MSKDAIILELARQRDVLLDAVRAALNKKGSNVRAEMAAALVNAAPRKP